MTIYRTDLSDTLTAELLLTQITNPLDEDGFIADFFDDDPRLAHMGRNERIILNQIMTIRYEEIQILCISFLQDAGIIPI